MQAHRIGSVKTRGERERLFDSRVSYELSSPIDPSTWIIRLLYANAHDRTSLLCVDPCSGVSELRSIRWRGWCRHLLGFRRARRNMPYSSASL